MCALTGPYALLRTGISGCPLLKRPQSFQMLLILEARIPFVSPWKNIILVYSFDGNCSTGHPSQYTNHFPSSPSSNVLSDDPERTAHDQ